MQLRDVVRHRLVFFFLRAKNNVGIFEAPHSLVGRNHHDLKLVNLFELRRFRLRRSRHAAQLLIKPEIILKSNRGQRLVFLADIHAFLGLNRLVQAVAPAPSRHQSARERVHNNHFAVLHHVFHVALVKRVRLDRRLHVVLQFPVLRIGNIPNPQRLFDRLPARVRYADCPLLLVHEIVAAKILFPLARVGCPAPSGAAGRSIPPLRPSPVAE